MHVLTVLVVPMTVMQMVDVTVVLNRLASVPVGVRITMIRVHIGLRMPLTVVDVIHMVAMKYRLAPIVRQVLVIELFGVRGHENSFRLTQFSPCSARTDEHKPADTDFPAWFRRGPEQANENDCRFS
ncbi:hypothetical protein AB0E63_21530 [Kribbella sp. NPDC026596]|uniref:hypothetical protein n=1 Tax=Kribbella sp. NPDC026596 TaxID=3155122 RepID=UPI00340F1158